MDDDGMSRFTPAAAPICGDQRLAQLVECGRGGELEIGLLIELVRPDVPIGRDCGHSCEVGGKMTIHWR